MAERAEIVRDAVVVGGGAAGLSAALTLARARRRVTVVDAGAPRNAPASGVHGLLALDGLSPLELLARGRAEVTGCRRPDRADLGARGVGCRQLH
jgi:thioredoxin reductase